MTVTEQGLCSAPQAHGPGSVVATGCSPTTLGHRAEARAWLVGQREGFCCADPDKAVAATSLTGSLRVGAFAQVGARLHKWVCTLGWVLIAQVGVHT